MRIQGFEQFGNRQVCLIAGNPHVLEGRADGSPVVTDGQSVAIQTAISGATDAVKHALIFELPEFETEIKTLFKRRDLATWTVDIEGGRFPEGILGKLHAERSRIDRSGLEKLRLALPIALERVKQRVKLVIELDTGNKADRYLNQAGRESLAEHYKVNNSNRALRNLVSSGRCASVQMTLLRPEVQAIAAVPLSRSPFSFDDVIVTLESGIRGSMKVLAKERNWGKEVNLDEQTGQRFRREIYFENLESDDLMPACPAVDAGVLLEASTLFVPPRPDEAIDQDLYLLMVMQKDPNDLDRVSEIIKKLGIRFFMSHGFPHSDRAKVGLFFTGSGDRFVPQTHAHIQARGIPSRAIPSDIFHQHRIERGFDAARSYEVSSSWESVA